MFYNPTGKILYGQINPKVPVIVLGGNRNGTAHQHENFIPLTGGGSFMVWL